TVTVNNDGPSGALGATLTHALAPGVQFVSATIGGGRCTQTKGIVSCTIDTIDSGGKAVLQVRSVPVAAGTISATSTVFVVEHDPNTDDNTAVTTTQVGSPASGPAGLGDFDGDGDLDLAVADTNKHVVRIFANDGHGAFAERQSVAVGKKPTAL